MLVKPTTINVVYDSGVDRVLMIKKIRNANGFGDRGHLWKDKYNFPGGKVEPNETFTECAIRETREETGITPLSIIAKGFINFKGLDILIPNMVFLTKDFDGQVVEKTEEATVEWVKRESIPFDKMFPTDKLWVPWVWKKSFFMLDVNSNEKDGKLISEPQIPKFYTSASLAMKQINNQKIK